ncbi:MAG: class II aldolase/adducin family protein [Anaerolineaceae bacterium]|nr:class II aldolase/adducin family protein [Anaerolineaceae bacterium]
MLELLRKKVCELHQLLPNNDLVVWTSGNVSARDPESGLVVIKPSGVMYPDLTPEKMVVVDPDGKIVQGTLKPYSDTLTHLYIYRNRKDVNGIVHTHSPYATAFAAVGKPIPAVLIAICDEFGGSIPVAGFAPIGDEAIGKEALRAVGSGKAVLMQNHGVFTMGDSPGAAVKYAVLVENAARTVFLALQMGDPIPIPDDMIAQLHKRYTDEYGQ